MSDHESKRDVANIGATLCAAAMAWWYSTIPGTRGVGVFIAFAVLDIAYSLLVALKFGRREP